MNQENIKQKEENENKEKEKNTLRKMKFIFNAIENGWKVKKHCPHVPGMKDNWQSHADGLGNHVFVLEQ